MYKYFIFLLATVLMTSCNQGKRYHDTEENSKLNIIEIPSIREAITDVRQFQKTLNDSFKNAETSPLLEKDKSKFKSLSFFAIDTSYRVQAKLIRTPDELPFLMPTTTSRKSKEVKYGELHFKLKEKEFSLNVYQNVELKITEEYKDYLFMPYNDLTNGVETYGGGRYVDLSIPEGDTLTIDFNKSYNPYCTYNPKYSCPIVPSENNLNIAVYAGVKAYEK